jgi:hypothetical protein
MKQYSHVIVENIEDGGQLSMLDQPAHADGYNTMTAAFDTFHRLKGPYLVGIGLYRLKIAPRTAYICL